MFGLVFTWIRSTGVACQWWCFLLGKQGGRMTWLIPLSSLSASRGEPVILFFFDIIGGSSEAAKHT